MKQKLQRFKSMSITKHGCATTNRDILLLAQFVAVTLHISLERLNITNQVKLHSLYMGKWILLSTKANKILIELGNPIRRNRIHSFSLLIKLKEVSF